MNTKNNSYDKRFFLSEFFGIGVGFPVAAAYVLILLNMELTKVIHITIFSTIVAVGVELFMAQPTNFFISRKVRQKVRACEAGTLRSSADMISFLNDLGRLPVLNAVLMFFRISFGSLITVVYMHFSWMSIDLSTCVMAFVLALYGAFIGGLLAFVSVSRLHSDIQQDVVSSGLLDEDVVAEKKFFGLSLMTKNILFMFVPVVMTNLSVLFCIYTGQGVLDSAMKLRITGDVLVSVITLFACMTFSTRMTLKPLASLEKSLGIFSSGHGTFSERLPTDLSDDFAFVVWLMNRAIGSFQEILSKLKAASQNLNNSIQELNVSTQEISATSNQQAAGVKEIISTMEDSDQLSKRVASQANEVAKIAEGTKDVVATGFVIIKESLEKMESIKDANELSIRGIRELGDKIERIWDIVNIINGIADQTKIIAFNAELEAASAGEAGKSFQIVATEIRRLADSTVNSTNEIKARINEIQKSSDHLILSSEEGTSKIIAGWELSNKLRNLFGDILQTSEVSSDSARQIALSIEQQVVAFDQILITLKQISSGIDNFVTSTTSTSRLTRVLMDMSVDLHQVVAKYDEKPEN